MLQWRMRITGAPAKPRVPSGVVRAGLRCNLPGSVSIDDSGFVTIQRHLGVALTSVGAGDDIDMRLPGVFW